MLKSLLFFVESWAKPNEEKKRKNTANVSLFIILFIYVDG